MPHYAMTPGPERTTQVIDVVRFVVEQATRAPSSHNTQPWRFIADGGALELWADRTRALPVNDPDDRELTISCGAALLNARAAAARLGVDLEVQLLPDGAESDLLARCEFTEGDGDLIRLYPGIAERRTVRRPFIEEPVRGDLAGTLVSAARNEGVRLAILDPAQRRALADLVARGDRAQFADTNWRRELAAWIQPLGRGEGLAYPALAAPIVRFVVRHIDLGKSTARKDCRLAETAPLLAVLSTDGDAPIDWLQAGQALERVLLTAALEGIQASYLNQPIQVATLRPAVAELAGGEHAQIALRLGTPENTARTASRRTVEDVLGPRR